MADDKHGAGPLGAPAAPPALAASVRGAPSVGPAIVVGPGGVPAALCPIGESNYVGMQGVYLAASGTLTQFNAIIAALLTAALAFDRPLHFQLAIGAALVAHAVAGLLLCWAARPVGSASGRPTHSADDLLTSSFIGYRRGWRATMLALMLSAVALATLAWQQLGPKLIAVLS